MKEIFPIQIITNKPKTQAEVIAALKKNADLQLSMFKRWNRLELLPAQAGNIQYLAPNHPVVFIDIQNLSNIVINQITNITEGDEIFNTNNFVINNNKILGFTGLKGDNTYIETPLVAANKYRVKHLRIGQAREIPAPIWQGPFFIKAALSSGGVEKELEYEIDDAGHTHIISFDGIAVSPPTIPVTDDDPDFDDSVFIPEGTVWLWVVTPISEFDFYNGDFITGDGDIGTTDFNGTNVSLTITDIDSVSFQKLTDDTDLTPDSSITEPLIGLGVVSFNEVLIGDRCVKYNSKIFVTGTVQGTILKKTTEVLTKIVNNTVTSPSSNIEDGVPFDLKSVLTDNLAADYLVFNDNPDLIISYDFTWQSDNSQATGTFPTSAAINILGVGESGVDFSGVKVDVPPVHSGDILVITSKVKNKFCSGDFNIIGTLESTASGVEVSLSIDTTKPGSAADTIVLPFTANQNLTIDWGDGNIEVITTAAEATHTYSVGGIKNIKIKESSGNFVKFFRFNSVGDKLKLLDIISWNKLDFGTSGNGAFFGCSNMTISAKDLPKTDLMTDGTNFFLNCSSLTTVPLLDLSSMTNGTSFFENCIGLTTVPLFNLSVMTLGKRFLQTCTSLTSVPLFNLSSLITGNDFFFGCTSLASVPLFILSSLTDGSSFLRSCPSLTTVPLFDLSSMTNGFAFLKNCTGLTSVPLFNLSSMTNGTAFFESCTGLTTVPLFNLSVMTNGDGFFFACTGLTSVPLFILSVMTNGNKFFRKCTSLTSIPLYDLSSMTTGVDMFRQVTLNTTDWSNLLVATEANNSNNNVTWSGGNSFHNAAGATAITALAASPRLWIITDNGLEP